MASNSLSSCVCLRVKVQMKVERWLALESLGQNAARNAQAAATIHFLIRDDRGSSSKSASLVQLIELSGTESSECY